mmetsp:Transcript_74517/g.155351  ORF Transcript_74517/g.155351 Transcript_74517/m.155351 type:complete len:80 (-) Transcript_74517:619-858(-)
MCTKIGQGAWVESKGESQGIQRGEAALDQGQADGRMNGDKDGSRIQAKCHHVMWLVTSPCCARHHFSKGWRGTSQVLEC